MMDNLVLLEIKDYLDHMDHLEILDSPVKKDVMQKNQLVDQDPKAHKDQLVKQDPKEIPGMMEVLVNKDPKD